MFPETVAPTLRSERGRPGPRTRKVSHPGSGPLAGFLSTSLQGSLPVPLRPVLHPSQPVPDLWERVGPGRWGARLQDDLAGTHNHHRELGGPVWTARRMLLSGSLPSRRPLAGPLVAAQAPWGHPTGVPPEALHPGCPTRSPPGSPPPRASWPLWGSRRDREKPGLVWLSPDSKRPRSV